MPTPLRMEPDADGNITIQCDGKDLVINVRPPSAQPAEGGGETVTDEVYRIFGDWVTPSRVYFSGLTDRAVVVRTFKSPDLLMEYAKNLDPLRKAISNAGGTRCTAILHLESDDKLPFQELVQMQELGGEDVKVYVTVIKAGG
jgi:hypothetical protein